VIGRVAVSAVGITATVVVAYAAPASGVSTSCNDTTTDYCVEDEIVYPGTTEPAAPPRQAESPEQVGTPARQTAPAPRCTWVSDPGALAGGDGSPGAFPDVGTRPGTDAYLIFERCGEELSGQVRWATPTEPAPAASGTVTPAPPSPEALAATIRVRLEGNLPRPVASTSPAAGRPAIVNHPTFLAIDNWTSAVTDRECAFLLCVTVTATPTLTWGPGEPGAPTLTCAGGGTRFNPEGASPQEQAAAPNACAHAYQARTGAGGRPDQWPGVATVTWDLAWTSTTGAGGALPPVVRSTDVPRAVDEVQAIVVR
jgi:hypothetical protein